jgi:methionyl-tRNA formyltransferase
MRVALFAADDIALPLFRSLAKTNQLACLITQPDKPRGRGKKIVPLPISEEAMSLGVKVLAPTSLKSAGFIDALKSIKIDIPIVFAYGLYIPEWIRNWNPFPCINVHPSLLPRWRGPDPVRSSIMNGDTETSVTIHFTEKTIDTGNIICVSEKTQIGPDTTYDQLKSNLSEVSKNLIDEFLERISRLDINPCENKDSHPGKKALTAEFNCIAQDESKATFSKKIEKMDLWIDWSKTSRVVHNHIRALSENPGARTGSLEKSLKILFTSIHEPLQVIEGSKPSDIISIESDYIVVACGEGSIKIHEVQPSGKKKMTARDFVNGYRIKINDSIVEF